MISYDEYLCDIKAILINNDLWRLDGEAIKYSGSITVPDVTSNINDVAMDYNSSIDDDLVYTKEPNAHLQIVIQYCKIYSVPTIYFTVVSIHGVIFEPDYIWRHVFHGTDFVGKISYEQYVSSDGTTRRMLRLHPCTTKSILAGVQCSSNKTADLLNILLRDFIAFDNNIYLQMLK